MRIERDKAIRALSLPKKEERKQRLLWFRLVKHFTHIEYFSIGDTEYKFDGNAISVVQ